MTSSTDLSRQPSPRSSRHPSLALPCHPREARPGNTAWRGLASLAGWKHGAEAALMIQPKGLLQLLSPRSSESVWPPGRLVSRYRSQRELDGIGRDWSAKLISSAAALEVSLRIIRIVPRIQNVAHLWRAVMRALQLTRLTHGIFSPFSRQCGTVSPARQSPCRLSWRCGWPGRRRCRRFDNWTRSDPIDARAAPPTRRRRSHRRSGSMPDRRRSAASRSARRRSSLSRCSACSARWRSWSARWRS